ncbi:uncharacterized protein LOC135817977 [Sycon ciliatum]|uniref:uncharacterized protein LOC135817977 n=1 Tax=Sycon ciliatum TaxID=27933 RepID=UPI0031F71D89
MKVDATLQALLNRPPDREGCLRVLSCPSDRLLIGSATYCRVVGDLFACYSGKDAKSPVEDVISLLNHGIQVIDEENTFGFELEPQSASSSVGYRFACQSLQEADYWVETLSTCKDGHQREDLYETCPPAAIGGASCAPLAVSVSSPMLPTRPRRSALRSAGCPLAGQSPGELELEPGVDSVYDDHMFLVSCELHKPMTVCIALSIEMADNDWKEIERTERMKVSGSEGHFVTPFSLEWSSDSETVVRMNLYQAVNKSVGKDEVCNIGCVTTRVGVLVGESKCRLQFSPAGKQSKAGNFDFVSLSYNKPDARRCEPPSFQMRKRSVVCTHGRTSSQALLDGEDLSWQRDRSWNIKLSETPNWLAVNKINEAVFSVSTRCSDNIVRHVTDPCNYPIRELQIRSSSPSVKLSITERMGESSLTWILPSQLITVFRGNLLSCMSLLGTLPLLRDDLEPVRTSLMNAFETMASFYSTASCHAMATFSKHEITFKQSTQKSRENVEFIGTNLHVQRLCVSRQLSTTSQPTSQNTEEQSSASSPPRRKNVEEPPLEERASFRRAFRFLKRSSAVGLSSSPAASPKGSPVLQTPGEDIERKENVVEKKEDNACLNKVYTELAPQLDNGAHDVVTVGAPSAHSLRFKGGGLHRLLASSNPAHLRQVKLFRECQELAHALQTKMMTVQKIMKDAVAQANLVTIIPVLHTVQSTIEDTEQLGRLVRSAHTDLDSSLAFPAQDACEDMEVRAHFEAAILPVITGEIVQVVLNDSDSLRALQIKINSFFDLWQSSLHHLRSSVAFLMLKCFMNSPSLVAGKGSLLHRQHIVLSQAISGVMTGILSRLQNLSGINEFFTDIVLNQGLLVVWDSLLSTHGDEQGMLEDMAMAMDMLENVTFEVTSGNIFRTTVEGSMDALNVKLVLPPDITSTLPSALLGCRLSIVPCLFTQGVNENQFKSDWFGTSKFQEIVNVKHYERLSRYVTRFRDNKSWYAQNHESSSMMSPVAEAEQMSQRAATYMEMLRGALKSKKERNIDILTCASQVCLLFDGVRLMSCKSAKDRTAMMVTLEANCYLLNRFNMPLEKLPSCLAAMRSLGTRIQNTRKNIGEPRYAFQKVQLQCFPKLLRPPDGSYGSMLT